MSAAESLSVVAEDGEGFKPQGSKLVPILLIVNSILLAGVLGFLVMGGGAASSADDKAAVKGESGHGEASEGETEGEGEHGAKKANSPGPVVSLKDFTVHLRNPEANRYAKITFNIEVRAEGDQAVIEEQTPAIRDAFISYLSDRTAEELQGADALARLKKSLIDILDGLGDSGRVVRAIYVTDLVLQ